MDAVEELAVLIGVQYLRAYLLMDEGARLAMDTLIGIVHDGSASPKVRDKALEKIHTLTRLPWRAKDNAP